MDRRTFFASILGLPLVAGLGLPVFMEPRPELWSFAGRKTLERVTTEVSFALPGGLRGSERFKVIAQNQTVWIDTITLQLPGGKSAPQSVRKTLPPGQRLEIAIDAANAAGALSVTLHVTYLPFDGEPAALLLWGEGGA